MDWFEALKIYGKEGHSWHIPEKGSEGYKMIKAIQHSEVPKPEPVKSAKRVIKKEFSEEKNRLLEEIMNLKDNAIKFTKEGSSADEMSEYYNVYIMPLLERYEKEFVGVRGASSIVDDIHDSIRSAYHSEEAVKAREPKKEEKTWKEEAPPKKKAKSDYTRQELQEIVYKYYASKGMKFGNLFSKGKLLTLIKMNKIPMP